MSFKPNIPLDNVRGMFMGAFLGDALGAPHEFKCNTNVTYTGILENKAFRTTQYQGKKELSIGQATDDSEMSLALLRTLIRDGKYIKDNVIMSYLQWANSGGWMMGKNTRTLLKGIKTIKGYQKRIEKILDLPIKDRSQSNGALMRCSALALIFDNNPIIEDVSITNPNPVCMDCELIYVNALRLALQGADRQTIFNTIKPLAQTEEVKLVLDQVEKREIRNIVENKGWVLHGLWCAMTVMLSFDNYGEAMRFLITIKGSDTDTNACIAGSLLGAILGFEKLQQEPDTVQNINILLNADSSKGLTPRPLEYSLYDFYTLTEAAHALTL